MVTLRGSVLGTGSQRDLGKAQLVRSEETATQAIIFAVKLGKRRSKEKNSLETPNLPAV
jgi:hypothetical protein